MKPQDCETWGLLTNTDAVNYCAKKHLFHENDPIEGAAKAVPTRPSRDRDPQNLVPSSTTMACFFRAAQQLSMPLGRVRPQTQPGDGWPS
jgi:hypothetical protein